MTRRLLSLAATAAALALPPGLAGAADAVPAKPPPAAAVVDRDAVQDIIFLGEARPVFIRLHVMAGDKGFRAAWMESIRAIYASLDRNGDGKLTKDEVDRTSLGNLVRSSSSTIIAQPRRELDSNKDGVISVEELADALSQSLSAFRVQVDRAATNTADALFIRLDRNKDGILTREELGAASTSLHKLDLDDDEQVAATELEPFTNPMAQQFGGMLPRTTRFGEVDMPVIELDREDKTSIKSARQLLNHYDKRKDGKLTPAEFAVETKVFARADEDGDGILDSGEVARYLAAAEPDFELDVKLAGDGVKATTVDVTQVDAKGSPAVSKVNRLTGGDVEVILGEIHLEIHVDDGATVADDAKKSYAALFKSVDGDNNGYLEKKELKEGQGGALATLFDVMDKDGDGKLYPEEVNALVDRQVMTARGRMVLSVADQGRAIFSLLDTNRDRRLGVRELRGTVTRISAWDRSGDGRVGATEVPHHYQLTLRRGQLAAINTNAAIMAAMGMQPEAAEPATLPGPAWFRRMDRNRDGDVSRREFFGPRAEFKRLDRDGDGLIDATEAAQPRK